jgi:hypothetical protein
MLQHLPASQAEKWRKECLLVETEEENESENKTEEAAEKELPESEPMQT